MTVSEAWLALGEDPNEIFNSIKSCPNAEKKVLAAEAALVRAERLAKVLMAAHHPDKNPGDISAEKRFKRVASAIESIRFNTKEMKEKASKVRDEPKEPFISFK